MLVSVQIIQIVNVGKNKLIEECTENVKKEKITEITLYKNKNKHKRSSCTMFIALFSIILTIKIGIGTYFVYSHWYLKTGNSHAMLNTRTEITIY